MEIVYYEIAGSLLAAAAIGLVGAILRQPVIGAGGLAGVIIGKAAMVVLLVLFVRHAAEPLMTRLAGTPKLFVIFAIGWAAAAAPLGRFVGFGKELGGLAAGVSHEMSDKRTNTGTPAST